MNIGMSVVTVMALAVSAANAQDRLPAPASPPPPPSPPAISAPGSRNLPSRSVPLEVQITISRWQGDKKTSSLPYVLRVNAVSTSPSTDLARLRIGSEIPVLTARPAATTTPAPPAPPGSQPSGSAAFEYKAIGTNIDCTAVITDEGNYRLQMTIEDSSVYTDDRTAPGPVAASTPVFRSFRLSNTAVLRDGQSTQFTASADKVSGDIVKVDVAVKVIK